MNKLFTKIASLTLGLALVASAGAFLGGRAVKSASATEALAYKLDGTVTGGSSKYEEESDITQSEISWKVCGNTTMSPWRIGGKSLTGVDRAIYSVDSINYTITKVDLSVGAASSITVNSLKLIVASDNAFNTVVEQVSGTFAANSTIKFEPSTDWTNCYYKFVFNVTVSGTSNKFVAFNKAEFYYESETARGDASIEGLSSQLLFVNDSVNLSCGWDPLDSGADIATYSFSTSDADVLTVSGNTIEAVAPGKAKITLNATDTNSEAYEVVSDTIYVSNAYDFEIDDTVVIYSEAALMELTSINNSGSTHYAEGTAYVDSPNGTLLWTVEEGNVSGSLAFVNDGNYLSWSSGNSLDSKTTKDDNSSWYVVTYESYSLIINAAQTTREIWWNSGNPRFACYESKTPETTGYNTVNLTKIEDAPVRGTISIANEFGSTMRQNATDSLSYNWTPAEASEATIVSHTWSSTNSDAIAISGDTYTAVGPGKAKISLAATDSNGQEYSVSTKDITVIEVVSGSYVQYTSISDGDEVALVCKTAGTQLSGVSSNIGQYVFYSSDPAGIYNLTLESSGDYYLLKNSENKYLTWGDDGADIKMVDEAVDKSYWTISFDEEHNAIISNKVADGEVHRYLAWNNGSPRFAAYKTGQTAVQLYGPELELSANAIDFIENLNSLTCDDSGDTAPDVDAWKALKDQYESSSEPLSSQDKATISTIKAIEHASPVTVKEQTEAAMAKYDYIVAKYNLGQHLSEEYPDFIGRDPDPLRNITEPIVISNNTNSAIIAVTVIALTSVSAIAVLLVIKRRKTY